MAASGDSENPFWRFIDADSLFFIDLRGLGLGVAGSIIGAFAQLVLGGVDLAFDLSTAPVELATTVLSGIIEFTITNLAQVNRLAAARSAEGVARFDLFGFVAALVVVVITMYVVGWALSVARELVG